MIKSWENLLSTQALHRTQADDFIKKNLTNNSLIVKFIEILNLKGVEVEKSAHIFQMRGQFFFSSKF